MDLATLGVVANVTQLAGLDTLGVISLIVETANNARMHKKNCKKFAQHIKLIENLLVPLQESKLWAKPELREPLQQLDEQLRKAWVLVKDCQDCSCLYMLVMGRKIVNRFERQQSEIDRILRLIPLMTLAENDRLAERLEAIERHKNGYTLDEEEDKLQKTIKKSERPRSESGEIESVLSMFYPGIPLETALKEEREKLWKIRMETELIQDLIHWIEIAAATGKDREEVVEFDNSWKQKWHYNLFGCLMAPKLCMSTFFYPCGTFTLVASDVTDGKLSPKKACTNCMICSLIFGCFCYTCCSRKKLRKRFRIQGCCCCDLLAHCLCFKLALVQEARELKFHKGKSYDRNKQIAPKQQNMTRY